ncbi:MAG: single-stranded DNA-binding protein [Bacteroidetes bacterium]|jgi:single-strand DNA-binding protein|nr:single-stranded DNA-binding protein [Bacteroidota bacterium]MBK8143736.1 single-stranded DNA-binding protein [Bacteroidota bacterium]MBP6316279.1 single-stranded DNA-binding protein [Chitinophagaceae bacterium]
MYALKNKVQLIGYLGQTPEIKTTDSDRKYAKFSLATNEEYKNSKGEKVSETQWHHLVAWGKVAELVEKYLHKGSEIAIEGKLMYNEFTDASGAKRYITEIQVNELLLLDKKAEKELMK